MSTQDSKTNNNEGGGSSFTPRAWGDAAHQVLVVGLADALDATESSVTKSKEIILAAFVKSGYTFTWEGVR